MSRSSVGSARKGLLASRLITPAPTLHDRRTFFQVPGDVRTACLALAEDKRQRELAPALLFLQTLLRAQDGQTGETGVIARIRMLYDLLDMISGWFDDMQKLSPATQIRHAASGLSHVTQP